MPTPGRAQGADRQQQKTIEKLAKGGTDLYGNEIPPMDAGQIGQILQIEDSVVAKFMPKRRGRPPKEAA